MAIVHCHSLPFRQFLWPLANPRDPGVSALHNSGVTGALMTISAFSVGVGDLKAGSYIYAASVFTLTRPLSPGGSHLLN